MKKILVLFVAIIAIFGLTACGGNSNNSGSTTGSTASTGTTGTTGGTPIEASNNLFGDKTPAQWREYYKGQVNIDNNNDGTPDWQQTPLTITYAGSFYDDSDQYNTIFRNALKWASKYPNITLERDPRFVHSAGDDSAQLELLIASSLDGSMPDFYYSPKGAEMYDQGLTLDLIAYLRTDEEAMYISQNAVDAMTTYDGEQIYGVAFMSVSQFPAVNVGLLRQLNIQVPSYDWNYQNYEDLRQQVGVVTDSGRCIYPGVINWSEYGSHYFDSIPNGWFGFNSAKQRYDFASAVNFGDWFQLVADEGDKGWHYYDLSTDEQQAVCGNFGFPWGDGFQAIDNIWMYNLSTDVNNFVKQRGLEIEIYPMPQAPTGGTTALHGYYDTFSLSYELESDKVKADAVYNLVKWLSYGEDGLISRWDMIEDDINTYGADKEEFILNGGNEADFPLVHPSTNLMDYIMGWPITTNEEVLRNHPLVKGFPEDSIYSIYNFDAFQNTEFQRQLSGPVPYPRTIPAATASFKDFDSWAIKNQMRLEGYYYADIAGAWDDKMNKILEEYLLSYNNQ